jgi:hypothetical protein
MWWREARAMVRQNARKTPAAQVRNMARYPAWLMIAPATGPVRKRERSMKAF